MRQPLPHRMEYHAGRSSRMSGRQKGRRTKKPTHAETHGWAVMAGSSNGPSRSSNKYRRRVIYRSRKTLVKPSSLSCSDITYFRKEIWETGPWPPVLVPLSRRSRRCHDADAGRKIDTTSATLINAMICGGDTISRLDGHGRPGAASGEFAVLAIDAPPLNMRGGMVPAEVVAPDHPITEAMPLECVAPLQTIVRSARRHSSPRQRLAPKEGARWFAFRPRS